MSSKSLLISLFQYKAWANEELFSELLGLKERDRSVIHSASRILNHVYVVDRIFAAHLQGKRHAYTATNTEETPTLEDLFSAVRETDTWYLEYIAELPPDNLTRGIDFTFTDGNAGRMSCEEILAHLIAHGGYHRGAVGRVVAQLSAAPPRDSFSCALHSMEPERRSAALSSGIA